MQEWNESKKHDRSDNESRESKCEDDESQVDTHVMKMLPKTFFLKTVIHACQVT